MTTATAETASSVAHWRYAIFMADGDLQPRDRHVALALAARADPRTLDLPGLHVTVTKNGDALSEGYGAAVQGSPAAAVAWLANTLGAFGVTLDAGDIILSGSLVPLADAVKGDVFEMTLHGVGSCTAKFV
jgi:2-oxopent-4-enoate/cis-2-oxohex-4-enoate hydratase